MLIVRVDGQDACPRTRPGNERPHLLERDGGDVHRLQPVDERGRNLLGRRSCPGIHPRAGPEREARIPLDAPLDAEPDRRVLRGHQPRSVAGVLERFDERGWKPPAEPGDQVDVVREDACADRRVERVAAEPPPELPAVRQDDVLDQEVTDRQVAGHGISR